MRGCPWIHLLHALTFLFIFPFIFFPVLSFFASHRLKALPVGVAQALRVSSVHSNRQISCSSLSANPLASRGRHYNVEDVGRLAGRRAGKTPFAPALSPLHLRRRHCLACNRLCKNTPLAVSVPFVLAFDTCRRLVWFNI